MVAGSHRDIRQGNETAPTSPSLNQAPIASQRDGQLIKRGGLEESEGGGDEEEEGNRLSPGEEILLPLRHLVRGGISMGNIEDEVEEVPVPKGGQTNNQGHDEIEQANPLLGHRGWGSLEN